MHSNESPSRANKSIIADRDKAISTAVFIFRKSLLAGVQGPTLLPFASHENEQGEAMLH